MYIFKQYDIIPWEGCAATIGFFDGVHSGHRYLIQELKAIAKANHLNSAVITFDTHPRKILQSDYQPRLLTTLEEKTDKLNITGVDACVLLNFTKELSQMTAEKFIRNVLQEKLKVKILLIGYDHRFGSNRTEGFEEYKEIGEKLGMQVLNAASFSSPKYEHISSSEIRRALDNGEVDKAAEMLTFPYTITGKVIPGNQLGRKLGFPTANIIVEDLGKVIPGIGVYAVKILVNGKIHKGMMNIGYKPTLQVSSKSITMEIHILDFDDMIYNKTIKVEFIQKLRNEQKFKTVDLLIEQLIKDRDMLEKMNW